MCKQKQKKYHKEGSKLYCAMYVLVYTYILITFSLGTPTYLLINLCYTAYKPTLMKQAMHIHAPNKFLKFSTWTKKNPKK